MSIPAQRPHLRTRDLIRLKAKADARRVELAHLDAFFSQHLLDVKARLRDACKSYDDKRYYWRVKHLKAVQDQELDESPVCDGRTHPKPQLWQVEGDAQ